MGNTSGYDVGNRLGFGDIAIREEGSATVVYGSATELPGFRVIFFKMNLDGSGYTVIKTGDLYGAGGTQIAFGSNRIWVSISNLYRKKPKCFLYCL